MTSFANSDHLRYTNLFSTVSTSWGDSTKRTEKEKHDGIHKVSHDQTEARNQRMHTGTFFWFKIYFLSLLCDKYSCGCPGIGENGDL